MIRLLRPSAALATIAGLAVALLLVAGVLYVRSRDTGTGKSGASSLGSGARLAEPDAARAFLAAAATQVTVVSSYDYRNLDSALSSGSSVTTGAYRRAYRSSLSGALGVLAKRSHTVQQLDVLRTGIGEMSKDGRTAKVMVFGNEQISDTSTGGRTRSTLVTLTATVQRQGEQYLISALDVGANPGLPPGSDELDVAAEAARSEVVDVLTYRRASFAADVKAALDGAVEPLSVRLRRGTPGIRAQLERGHYDLTGTVTAVAVEHADGDTASLLVAATGSRNPDTGASTVVTDGRYLVTVVKVQGFWVTSDIVPVTA